MKTGKSFMRLVLGAMLLLLLLLGLDPQSVKAAPTTKKISAGGNHTCALTAAERVWCWGANQYGQLGNGQRAGSPTPVRVLSMDGVKAISAGFTHTCALKSAGTVWCWGSNNFGQLGNGQSGAAKISATPVRVLNLDGVKAISAASGHTCALTSANTVKCWGSNYNGELGNGQSGFGKVSATPVRVPNLDGVTAVSAGSGYTCAIRNANTVWCWGTNARGQLGNGQSGEGKQSPVPVRVQNLSGISAISADGWHTCALKDGAVWCWGSNVYGELGNGQSGDGKFSATPVRVQNLSGVTAVDAGGIHTCALKNGVVWCWGDNEEGELGNGQSGSQKLSATPARVLSLSGMNAVSAGGVHTCALTGAGAVWCWGYNGYGQLGNGQSDDISASPVAVVWPTTSQ